MEKKPTGISTILQSLMKLISFCCVILIICACGNDIHLKPVNQIAILKKEDLPDYSSSKQNVLKIRDSLRRIFQGSSESTKKRILDEAGTLFTQLLTEKIFPHWYGTAWDFNGTTEVPGTGNIACGYFVTTTLRDAGIKINRYKVAQQAAEKIVTLIASEQNIKRFRNSPIDVIQSDMKLRGDGLYIVGLDFHVGYLLQAGDSTHFIHSNYLNRSGVMKESPWRNSVFYYSRYKIIGKIDTDESFLKNWLNHTQ